MADGYCEHRTFSSSLPSSLPSYASLRSMSSNESFAYFLYQYVKKLFLILSHNYGLLTIRSRGNTGNSGSSQDSSGSLTRSVSNCKKG